jgi:hypothetical protein
MALGESLGWAFLNPATHQEVCTEAQLSTLIFIFTAR